MARRASSRSPLSGASSAATIFKPRWTKKFKRSRDKEFERKIGAEIGLHLDSPEKLLVSCCAGKTQCEARERAQPTLPLAIRPVRAQTQQLNNHRLRAGPEGVVSGRPQEVDPTLSPSRDGPALQCREISEVQLIRRTEQKLTPLAWLRFVQQIDGELPKNLDIYLIENNYCTHKYRKVKAWLARYKRFSMSSTPMSSAWMNFVERLFADLTIDSIGAGCFRSGKQLTDAITAYMAECSRNPRPYRCKAIGKTILAKVHRTCQALAETGNNMSAI